MENIVTVYLVIGSLWVIGQAPAFVDIPTWVVPIVLLAILLSWPYLLLYAFYHLFEGIQPEIIDGIEEPARTSFDD